MNQIQELLRTGQYVEAERRLLERCEGPGADAESWFFLGAICGMKGDAARAEACFRKSLATKPDFQQARFNLGIALRDQGRLKEAQAELETVIASNPGHAEAANALGYVYVRLERQDDAERCFRSALARNPAFPDALINLGNVLCGRKRWVEAIPLYQRALELTPNHASAALNLGGALAALNRVDEAIACFRRSISADGRNPDAHLQLAKALKAQGKPREVEEACRQVLRIRPDDAEAHYFLGMLGADTAPPAAPNEHVARLFDDYAEIFDAHLVGKLRYRAPEVLIEAVEAAIGNRRDLDVLDLGCGTGLCGPLFRPLARTLVGVDLSPNMLEKARARAIYDALEAGELTAALLTRHAAVDLAIAADVLVYIGDLGPVFSSVAKALRPGGWFAFSVETAQPGEGDGYTLRRTGRYAHERDYVTALGERYGFEMDSSCGLCIREEAGHPIPGEIYVLRGKG